MLLVRNIRVPRDTTVTIRKEPFELTLATITMDKMDLRISLWGTGGGMNVMPAKVPSEFQSVRDGQVRKILVTESDDFSLCDEQSQLVFTSSRELAELNSSDL